MEDRYRNEFKYIVTDQQIILLQKRLDNLMQRDSHVRETGSYYIRSLYFDDYYNKCYYENLNGTDPREKYRIRIYNENPERISLECKRKEHGWTLKSSCPITIEQCKILLKGEPLPDIEKQPTVLRKLMMEMLGHLMKPVIIVGYDRIHYVAEQGNVRITFDINLSSSKELTKFFEKDIPGLENWSEAGRFIYNSKGTRKNL